ncbi:MAG TPA: FAD/NAD(P)-binding oxidoreductase [Solirubrobacteraceae bacterium]|nr:FAD/NAD(P)-binding oxidoreductase [Solirubrobacteraceae bacterium]
MSQAAPMSSSHSSPDPLRVVIAGGGVAGLEAALALGDLAPGRVRIELVAPNRDFVYRPVTVLEPFREALIEHFAVSEIIAGTGVDHRVDRVAWVDRTGRQVHTRSGASVPYDVLLLCPGADARPRYPQAATVTGDPGDPVVRSLVADIDSGAVTQLAFLVPGAGAWQLPLYELALLIARRARSRGDAVAISVFTPEAVPLEAFGERVGRYAETLLEDAGIELVRRALCRVPDANSLVVDGPDTWHFPGHRAPRPAHLRTFDRIVALPRLVGPHLRGVPAVSDGFIPVDTHGRILGAKAEFAAGDATNCPVKHGSVAAQQADAAARAIAALAGAPVAAAPFHPVIRGILLTGEHNEQLSASLVGGHSVHSELVTATSQAPEDKIDALYLAPRLASMRLAGTAAPTGPR